MRSALLLCTGHRLHTPKRGEREPVVCPNTGMASGRVARTKQPVQIADIRAEPAYTGDPQRFAVLELDGARTMLNVPMLKEDELVGARSPSTARKFGHSPTSRSSWFRTSLRKPSSPSRTRGCSMNYRRIAHSSRPPPLTCSRSSARRLARLDSVFEAMLEKAVRICDANFGMLFRVENDAVSAAALFGVPPKFAEFWQKGPQRPGRGTALSRVVETRQTIHIADVKQEPAYIKGEPVFLAAVSLGGFRTLIVVPMLKDNELVGAIGIYRQEVRPFTDKQIELLQNFAAQAVIAIENTRLLNELRQRTDDLSETLEQQTATSEVLKVISSSPGALEPVFNAMLENATRICEATFGHLWLLEGNAFRAVAVQGKQSVVDLLVRNPVADLRDISGTPLGRLAKTKELVHIPDFRADQSFIEKHARIVPLVELSGARTFVAVPMLKEGELIGAIAMYRQEVRPFTDKQIELVENFAAQAVIAIENAPLAQ